MNESSASIFAFLKEAMRNSEPTVDAAAKSLARFEDHTKYKDFKAFHFEQAIAFKRHLAEQKGQQSGERLSKSTFFARHSRNSNAFFIDGWATRLQVQVEYADAEYFNLSGKDTRIATTQREQKAPTLEQVKHVINAMPNYSDIERRNRALVAFTLLTGARDSAIASMKLKHY
ncbi:MAG: hypothetical protein IPP36_10880 [Nitrosomonadales bacterium]|nr:hypothetical protein [Nitrosomonadales bacterium]